MIFRCSFLSLNRSTWRPVCSTGGEERLELERKPFRVGTSIADVIFYFLKQDHVESFDDEYDLLRSPPP